MRINNQPDNRLLEQRSRLEFHYPQQDMILFLPFFENPVISESKAANLVEYDLLGRSSSMFAYTGAKARRFKVEVSYTLPHLINFNMGVERFRRLTTAESKEEQINLFMKSWNDTNYNNEYGSQSLATDMEREYWKIYADELGIPANQLGPLDAMQRQMEADELERAIAADHFSELPVSMEGGNSLNTILNDLTPTDKNKAVDTLVYFVNILRTSITNAATNPLLGPPIIRLVHGTMYQSIPCVGRSYSIEYQDEDWGYDLETLTPRKVKVSLDLSEVRMGDFGKFKRSKIIQRDNIAGWESVVNEPLTTDPGLL
jgi:hypothetical protein